MTEIERRALLGDARAQEECTQRGIVLPCPCCGKNVSWDLAQDMVYHNYGNCILSGKFIPLPQWNTRPTPPIGKCEQCARSPDIATRTKGMRWCRNFRKEVSPDNFCDKFAPKEEQTQ